MFRVITRVRSSLWKDARLASTPNDDDWATFDCAIRILKLRLLIAIVGFVALGILIAMFEFLVHTHRVA